MLKRILALAALGGLTALPACTNNSAAVEPSYTPTNVSTSDLQFQVGTANYNGVTFLNTVVTFRQPNGLSALLDNTPSITLPFANPAPASASGVIFAGNDAGKNQITGTVQTNNGVASSDPRTFPQTVGVYAYGLLASNSTTTGANNSVFYAALSGSTEANRSPYYGAAVGYTQRAFYVGAGNSLTAGHLGASLGTSFLGYPSGFTTFAITPTTGTYSMSVGLPNSSTPIPTFTSTTAMSSLTLLPNMPQPTYATDGAGGGSVTVTIPAGISEAAVFVRDIDPASGSVLGYYTLIFHGAGSQTQSFPGGTFTVGDTLSMVAIGFDYPAMEAVPIGANPPEAPVINNAGTACTFSGTSSTCPGQADITLAPALTTAE